MFVPRLRTAALVLASSFTLAACVYDNGYGYGGVSVGVGTGGYYDPYYDDYGYYASYGYPSHYGWYGGYYYPGTGYYIYDRRGHRHRWSDKHRRYWKSRIGRHHHHDGKSHWDGYRRGPSETGAPPSTPDSGSWRDRRRSRVDAPSPRPPSAAVQARAAAREERAAARAERREARRSKRED